MILDALFLTTTLLVLGWVLSSERRRERVMTWIAGLWHSLYQPQNFGSVERCIVRAATASATVAVDGRVFLPSTITVGLHPEDFELVEPILAQVQSRVTTEVLERAQARGWVADRRIDLTIVIDGDARRGLPRISALHEAFTDHDDPTVTQEDGCGWFLVPDSASAATIRLAVGVPLTVGRSRRCEMVLDDPKASRRHATLVPERDAVIVEDLESLNGTFVDGERVKRHRLEPGSTVCFGRSTFTCTAVNEAAPPTRGGAT